MFGEKNQLNFNNLKFSREFYFGSKETSFLKSVVKKITDSYGLREADI